MTSIGESWEVVHKRLMRGFWEAINAGRGEGQAGAPPSGSSSQYNIEPPAGFPEGSKEFFEAFAHSIVRVQMEGILRNVVDGVMTAISREISYRAMTAPEELAKESWEVVHKKLMQDFWELINANIERIDNPQAPAKSGLKPPEGFPEGSQEFFDAMNNAIVRVHMEGILRNMVNAAMISIAKEFANKPPTP